MTNIGWDEINRPTATGEWGQPHFWGAREDDWGLMGWSGYATPNIYLLRMKNNSEDFISSTYSTEQYWEVIQPRAINSNTFYSAEATIFSMANGKLTDLIKINVNKP